MDGLIEFFLNLMSVPSLEGKGWFARIVSGFHSAVMFVVTLMVVLLPVLAVIGLVGDGWGEMSLGIRLVVGSLGFLSGIIVVGSVGLFVRRIVRPAPGKEADRSVRN